MNPLHEALMEMTLGARLMAGYKSVGQTFDPKKMVHSITFNLNAKGAEILRGLTNTNKIEGIDADFMEDEVSVIDLEKHYYKRPDYVNKYTQELDALIEKWTLDRSEENTAAWVNYTNDNWKNSPNTWRLKVIGSVNDLVALVDSPSRDHDGRWQIVAFASENVPLQWISAFLREAGVGNTVSWYGHNEYSSDYGIATIPEESSLLIKTTPDILIPVIKEMAQEHVPTDDVNLTISQLYAMSSMVDELVTIIGKRKYLHKVQPDVNTVDGLIAEIAKVGIATGEDYWRLVTLLDRILNLINYRSQLERLIEAGKVLNDRVSKRAAEIYKQELEIGLKMLRKNDPRFKDFVITDEEMPTWRFNVMNGDSGASSLLRVMERRERRLDEAQVEKIKSTVYEEGESKTDKVRELIDNIAKQEQDIADEYIEEVKGLSHDAKRPAITEDQALTFLAKVYGEKEAPSYLEELKTLDELSDDYLSTYYEIVRFTLNDYKRHKFTREETGDFYLWLEKVNADKES